ncbi:mandelate racemase/muconate lactonizing enzyme domain-containing protein [Colletotrichum nymphaeae SA-01]|uniref:Mandelate racemase/muconate lactonizing enzyme domain-containing protein n=1 Tax=Colletotrichum nymphaeae SA-01 TaxID=1460502 RepID=A0A135S9A7_9PEZI|nr:mandelate racemase/muconate lactonizing enzyme domain-containing protein [Colletotrichum nymphaeae SA-01]
MVTTASVADKVFSPFEVACLDIQGKLAGVPVSDLLGGRVRDNVQYSAYLFYKWAGHPGQPDDEYGAALDPAGVVKQAKKIIDEYGFKAIKLKGGVYPPAQEVEAIKALHAAFPGVPLRLDPNAAWTVETSKWVAKELEGIVEYLEDPAPEIEGMAAVAKAASMPLATNMAVVAFSHLPTSILQNAVQVVLSDHHFWGGLRKSQTLAAICSTWGMRLSMHSNSHLGISLAAMTHLASATPNLDYACDTHWPWKPRDEDVVVDGVLKWSDGGLNVPTAPGLGVELDRKKLAHLHQLYLDCGLRKRDDTTYMRKFHPEFSPNVPKWYAIVNDIFDLLNLAPSGHCIVSTMVKQSAGHRGNSARSILIGLAISLAGFVYGIDTGIIASTIAQTTFKLYMYGPSMDNVSVRAGIVSGYYAGYAFGSGGSAYCMDEMSRRWTLLFGACVSVVGAVLQTAAVNPAMMIVGRAFSGFSTGMVYPTAPVYLAELSPPENRGFLVGLKGLMNTLGFFVAGWVGYAGSFAVGELQWRIPLATQIPPALCLAVMTFFLPYSPRWLAMRERYDDAKKVMYSLHAHRGAETIEQEFAEMISQIQLEANKKKVSNFWNLFTRQYIRRTLLACLTVNMMKLSGSNIIQNYQSVMYNSLGYEGQTVLLIGGLYGFMAVIGQIINVFFVADHWTRRITVISGSFTLAVLLAVLTALSKLFQDDSNPAGSRAGVAFIFLFAFAYSFFFNSVNWVLVAEIFPLDLRGVGVGFSVFTQAVTAIWLSYAASVAFDAIEWKFYFVFIACNAFAGTIYFFFLPETRFLSLEEVAARFGDEIVSPGKKGPELD